MLDQRDQNQLLLAGRDRQHDLDAERGLRTLALYPQLSQVTDEDIAGFSEGESLPPPATAVAERRRAAPRRFGMIKLSSMVLMLNLLAGY